MQTTARTDSSPTPALAAESASRANMVEQQIRTWEVLDDRILALYYELPREEFAPPKMRDLAFADMELPIGFGQTMLSPKLEARILQSLELKGDETVLHVGAGSGYFAALLGRLCAHAATVEIIPQLADSAREKIRACGVHNTAVFCGDGACGFTPPESPAREKIYDAIALTGSTPIVSPSLRSQLKLGGRLAAVVGSPPAMTLQVIRRVEEDSYIAREILETVIAPLQNAPAPPRFSF